MKLFKMLGQVFELEDKQIENYQQTKTYIKNTKKNEDINLSNNIQSTYHPHTSKLQSFYVLFSPNGESLLVIDNKEKIKIKLYNIFHPNQNEPQAKKACNLLNDLLKKKKAFYETVIVNGKTEYKVYLDDKKKDCINDFLIESGLNSTIFSEQDQLKNEEIKKQYVSPKQVIQKRTNNNQGVVLRFGSQSYLFDNNNSLSYFIELNNNDKNTIFWGVDIERMILENNIVVGDTISIKNLGPQNVKINVPIKDNFGNILRQEEKTVKRNTWEANIIYKNQDISTSSVSAIKTVDNNTLSVKNDIRKNCSVLFATGPNSFSCMYQNKKHDFILANIDISLFTNTQLDLMENKLNELISKKVIYIEFKGNNIVNAYKNKNTFISINKELSSLIFSNNEINKKIQEEVTPTIIVDNSIIEPKNPNLNKFKKLGVGNKTIESGSIQETQQKTKDIIPNEDPFSDDFYSSSENNKTNIIPVTIDSDLYIDIPEYIQDTDNYYSEGVSLDDICFHQNNMENLNDFDEKTSNEPIIELPVVLLPDLQKVESFKEDPTLEKPKKLAFGKMKK